MTDWSLGYPVEIPYTIGYYREISPSWLELCLTVSGRSTLIDQKRQSGEPLRYLEIACGQGLSVNINAATHQGEFWGNDFIPEHAFFGQNLANASRANIRISPDSINELMQLKDLPNFDVITFHGVWSWIKKETMQEIIQILYDKLNAGGVVYASYNSNPGWSNSAPIRHLIDIHVRLNESNARNKIDKFRAGVELAKDLAESGAAYFVQSPQAVERLKLLFKQDVNYLVHEYSTGEWNLLNFEEAHTDFSKAKLSFAISASLASIYDSMVLSPKAKEILAKTQNVVVRETIHDYLHNTMFRKDIWVKGAVQVNLRQRNELLMAKPYALVLHPDNVPKTMQYQGAEITFHADIYRPIIEFLASNDFAPKTGNDVLKALPSHTPEQVLEALLILCATGSAHPARNPAEIAASRETSHNLNRYILAHSLNTNSINFIASPVIGSGVPIGRFQQMFLLASTQGAKTAADMAKKAWQWLNDRNERLVKDDRALDTEAENIAELTLQAEDFVKTRLPILQSLQVI
ncbi:MAG: class I SAM-dependent methyltransferase [Alphaproteobacteria bacterium]|nr:class I SAM-dependent methyltransferase [Alphaproteobacteria bacterium]